jgi:FixJ family two-component response regulator
MCKELDQRKSIHLVLNDSRLERQITQFLKDYAFNIRISNHISKFLREPLSRAPACLITSLELSEGDGMDLIKRVRSNGLSIPVIVIATEDGNVYSAVKALQAGAADFIQQPIMKKDFIERVDKVIKKLQ